jgi:hypothetical protein
MVNVSGGVGRLVPVVRVLERGDATGVWYWKGFPTKTLAFERHKCVPGHKTSKECLMVMCCENATKNHKLKFVLIRNAKKPQSVQGTDTKCIPVHYYNQNGAWINIFLKDSTSILFQKFMIS